ncbi:MAG: hypothetical protein LBH07_05270, partial [Treponema sp.]|nr:hypothetical protein [Treponema sp.]
HAELEVNCSSGTYIRSLVRDIAIALNSRAHLRSLERYGVGKFLLDKAISFDEAAEDQSRQEKIKSAILPMNQDLFSRLDIPCINLDGQSARVVSNGGNLRFLSHAISETAEKNTVIALFSSRSFAALIEKKNGVWKYGFVNANEDT